MRTGSSPLYRNLCWDNNSDLFGLKIGWDVAWTLVKRAALMVSPPGFRNLGGDSNDVVGDPFCHFGYFFVLNSFDSTIGSNDLQGLVPIWIFHQ